MTVEGSQELTSGTDNDSAPAILPGQLTFVYDDDERISVTPLGLAMLFGSDPWMITEGAI